MPRIEAAGLLGFIVFSSKHKSQLWLAGNKVATIFAHVNGPVAKHSSRFTELPRT
jgi:hypothetical protein